MLKHLMIAAAAGAMFSTGANQPDETPRGAAVSGFPVEWSISPAGQPDKVQLRLEYRRGNNNSSHSRTTPLAEIQGLSAAQLSGAGPASFRLGGEAGTLDCRGTLDRGRGIGTCDFRPDAAFAAELERRGIGRPTPEDLYHMAMQRVGRDLLNELGRHDYERPTVKDLVSASIHGVTAQYVREMADAGHRVGTVDRLVAFRIHGVTPRFIREIADASPNLIRLHGDQLVELRIHGVSGEFVRGMAEAGYRDLSPRQLVEMRIHGVRPAFVKELADLGYRNLSSRDLVALRIHGVNGSWVRELHQAGIRPASADALVEERIMGRRHRQRR